MAKKRGKSGETPVLDGSNASRFRDRHNIVSRRKASRRDEFYAQEYAEKVLNAHTKYVSSMKELREKLRLAQEGLAKIDEKGMTDDIIAAIEKIEKIQRMEISLTSSYTTELAGYDSERLETIRTGGDAKDIFMAESFDTRIKLKNSEVKQSIAALDEQYNELESSITPTKDYTPTDEDVLAVRRKQKAILEEKQQQMLSYAQFLEQTAKYRSEVIDPSRRRKEEEEALERDLADTAEKPKAEKPAESPEETAEKKKKIESAFSDAEKKSHPKWEAFKALPVVSHLIVGGSFIKHKLDEKLEPFKSDIKAAYAVMKERKQVRKIEKDLSRLDELQGNSEETSHVARFKAILAERRDALKNEAEAPKSEATPASGKTDSPLVPVTDIPESKPAEAKAEPAKSTEEAAKADTGKSGAPAAETSTDAPATEAETKAETKAEPPTPESIHDARVKRAANQAALKSLDESGLRQMINDYYWSDVADTHDVLKDLESSENVMGDLTQYTDRLKRVISHFPDEELRKALTERVDTAMTGIYQSKTDAEKKVSDAEARIRDSQAFLESLDSAGPAPTDVQAGI